MKRKNIILIHVLFWFYIINQSLFPFYIGQLDASLLAGHKYFKDVIITTLLNMLSFYPVYLLFPVLLKFKSRFKALLTGMIVLVAIIAFRVLVEHTFWKLLPGSAESDVMFKTAIIWNNLRMVIIIGIYAILIGFMINWFQAQKLRDALVNQQQASELALMRSQVNPHFLFNTLNNIYALAYRKSDQAPKAIMKLSSIMRYMLYDSALQQVPLEKEIEYLNSFIELQSLRFKDPDFVSVNIEGNFQNLSIAPMLLISFVENAFKHCNKNQRPGIIIHLEANEAHLRFEIKNFVKNSGSTHKDPLGGIGLDAIRRRLQLIYPGRHVLSILTNENTFHINLEITNANEDKLYSR